MKEKEDKARRFRPADVRPPRRPVRVRQKTYRDYAGVRRLGRCVRIGGVVLAVVLLLYAGYVVVRGVIPYMERQAALEAAASSSASEESTPSSTVQEPLVYDELGLPVYENAVSLRMINRENPTGAEDVPSLATFQGGLVDERIVPALEAMVAAAAEDGVEMHVLGGYVSYAEQENLFNDCVRRLEGDGLTHIMAMNNAEKQVGRAGMCDMQTGMCVRLGGDPETFTTTRAYAWLNNHALTYGFVFRYPVGTDEATGHGEDPTVLRYVGAANARQMRRLNMTLEEYAAYVAKQG